jgi:hypothetical protein
MKTSHVLGLVAALLMAVAIVTVPEYFRGNTKPSFAIAPTHVGK